MVIGRVAGFFGAGTLVAARDAVRWRASGSAAAAWRALRGQGMWPVWRLGLRNATLPSGAQRALHRAHRVRDVRHRRGRGVQARRLREALLDRHSGGGGYPLLARDRCCRSFTISIDAAGRDAMNLPAGPDARRACRFDRFRVRPGDDTSCLNLYQPKNPRILGATPDFIDAGRFAFHSSLAETPEEHANPWLLLNREFPDGAIPVIADANSMTYVLHMKLGDDLVLPGSSERPVRLRLVAALVGQHFSGRAADGRVAVRARRFPSGRAIDSFCVDAPRGQTGSCTAAAGITTGGLWRRRGVHRGTSRRLSPC